MATKPSGSAKDSSDKSMQDQAVDAFVYAPVGLALELLDQVPGWVARGKSQVTLGRLFAKMAVDKGQNEFGDAMNDVLADIFGLDLRNRGSQSGDAASGSVGEVIDAQSSEEAPVGAPKAKAATKATKATKATAKKPPAKKPPTNKTTKPKPAGPSTAKAKAAKPKSAKPKTAKPKAAKPKSAKPKSAKPKTAQAKPRTQAKTADLGLSSYDTLSASQIVKRLDSLSAKQLEAVQAHEQAGRRRVTVLNRIRQIQRAK